MRQEVLQKLHSQRHPHPRAPSYGSRCYQWLHISSSRSACSGPSCARTDAAPTALPFYMLSPTQYLQWLFCQLLHQVQLPQTATPSARETFNPPTPGVLCGFRHTGPLTPTHSLPPLALWFRLLLPGLNQPSLLPHHLSIS